MAEYIQKEPLLEHAEYDNNYRLIIPVEAIKAAPVADVAPVVHGRWIQVDSTKCRCSHCDIIALIALYPHGDKNFCPNCGAKMDGGADNG